MATISPRMRVLYERLEGSSSENITAEAATEWLIRMRPKLLAMARDLMSEELRAKIGPSDIVQQTYIDAVRGLENFGAPSAGAQKTIKKRRLAGWIQKLLRNNVYDVVRTFKRSQKRQLSRESGAPVELVPSRADEPLERMVDQELCERMLDLMSRLPEPHQQLLRWHYFDDLSFVEISRHVARKEDAVRMMVHRCLRGMREELDEHSSQPV